MDKTQFYNDDCFNVMKHIPDKSVDLILCDLPYGTTACKWDCVLPLDELWTEYERLVKDDGAIVLFGQEPFSSSLRMSNPSLYRYDWVWKKQRPSNFQLMNFQPGRVTENILVFAKGKACYVKNGRNMEYHPQMTKRDTPRSVRDLHIYGNTENNILHPYKGKHVDKVYESKHPINVLEFRTVEKGKCHPTQKPVDLLEYLIKTYTLEGDVVLDNCMGSGSTGVACANTGRCFIGIEKDIEYFKIAENRLLNTSCGSQINERD